MPHEYSDDSERVNPPERDESTESSEVDEYRDKAEEIAAEVSIELECQEDAEHCAEQAIKELEELDSAAERAEEIVKETMDELNGLEEELQQKLDDVREELHEEFVDDMEHKLGESEVKETSSETDADSKAGGSEETEASGETYIESPDGTVSVIQTGESSTAENEIETGECSDASQEQVVETPENPDSEGKEHENKINHPDMEEVEHEEKVESETQAPSNSSMEVEETPCDEIHEDEPKKKIKEQAGMNEVHEDDDSPETNTEEPHLEEVDGRCEQVEDDVSESEVQRDTSECIENTSLETSEEPDRSEQCLPDMENATETAENEDTTAIEISEELAKKIEELVEELDLSCGQEVDESRTIVDAMTGEEHIDTSLEPRPYFPVTDEDIEQEEQDRLRERLMELFSELTEEEREEFKEAARSKLETEEELEDLVKEWFHEVVSPDLKQKVEESKEFIRKKKVGEVPQLIRSLWALEVERAWAGVVGECILKSMLHGSTKSEKTKKSAKKRQAGRSKRKTGYHRGRARTIKLHRPLCGKRPVASFESYKRWLEQNYPGLCLREDYPVLLEQIRKFFELRDALKGLTTIRQFELDAIADRLGLRKTTARDWTFAGQSPHLFQIVDAALSKREAYRLRAQILRAAGGIGQWSDLEARLRQLYPGGEYKKIAQYSSKEVRVREFFAFLRELEFGGTRKGIARRSGISQRRVRAFWGGEVPWLIRHVLAQSGQLAPTRRYRTHNASLYRVKFRLPRVRGQEMRSYAQFKRLVDRKYPWLKERSDYERLMRVVRAYFDAVQTFSGQSHVTRDELVGFVKKYRVAVETVTEWIRGKSLPMVFNMLNEALSIDEARKELDAIRTQLNGVISLKVYQNRMKTFYLLEELKALPNYKKEYELVKEFFRFLKALEKGGLDTDLNRRGQLKMCNTKRRRLYHELPRLVRIAASIPSKQPKSRHQWLPMKVTKKSELTDFVEAPTRIDKASDLVSFLGAFVTKQRKLTTEESETDRLADEFMYLLGLLASDGSFHKKDGFSSRVTLKLSKSYEWSIRVGTAFCRALERFGVGSIRGKDQERHSKKGTVIRLMTWQSQNKPLFHWMRRTLLGNKGGPKRKLRIDWILKMSIQERTAYVQGVADGDGYASVRGLRGGIATKYNKKLISAILASLGIDSARASNGVEILRKNSLETASRLPLFRHADSRLFRLREICAMIAAMKHSRVSNEERQKILEYHTKQIKPTQITSLLWAEYGTARRYATIRKVIDDANQ